MIRPRNTRPVQPIVSSAKLDFDISYKNYEKISAFVNDRARILGQKRSGLTAKQQRLLSREIKRARYLGLLPFRASL